MQIDNIIPRFEDSRDRAAYLLAEYKLGVMLALGAVFILFASGRWELPEIPGWLALGLRGFALGIIPAMIGAKFFIIDPYMPDPRLKVVEWVPDENGNTLKVDGWRIPRSNWQEREHEEGMPILEPDGDIDAVVSRLEWDDAMSSLRVRGINPEIADPADLQSTEGKLDETFNDLLDAKRELSHMESTLKLRQQRVEEHTLNSIISTMEQGLNFDPAGELVEGEVFSSYGRDETTDKEDDDLIRSEDEMEPLFGPEEPAEAATDGGENR